MLGTTGTSGSVFDAGFIGSINGYFSEGTSTELMGPLIYSLVRSTRPKTVVELGAGYTSFWLCRAVMDAKAESEAERLEPVSWSLWDSPVGKNVLNEAMAQGTHSGTGRKLREAQAAYTPTLHVVDCFTEHYDQEDQFREMMRRTCPDEQLWRLAKEDWLDYEKGWPDDTPIDFLWLDGFNRETFDAYWPRVNPDGGVALLHSTMNNHRNYAFINELKMRQSTTSFTDYEMVSLVEPHKWNQNSCTLIRKVSEYNAEENIVRGRA